jgi:hypothetical protein
VGTFALSSLGQSTTPTKSKPPFPATSGMIHPSSLSAANQTRSTHVPDETEKKPSRPVIPSLFSSIASVRTEEEEQVQIRDTHQDHSTETRERAKQDHLR